MARLSGEVLKNWIVRNLGFKIVALVVAVVLWFGVKTDRQTEVRYPVPLEVQLHSDDETIVTPLPETVDVVFSGTGKDLLRLGDQHPRVRKELEAGPPGPRRVTLDTNDVTQSGSLPVKPVTVDPGVLTLTVDRIVTKRVPLRALGEMEPGSGYEVAGPVRFEPPAVILIGARSILARIDTVAVDLSQFRGSRSQTRTTSVRIPAYPNVVVQPDSIRVLLDLQEAGRGQARSRRSAS